MNQAERTRADKSSQIIGLSIALVIGTSILGLAHLRPSFQPPVAAAVLASSFAFSVLYGDLPFSHHFHPRQFQPEARYAAFAANLNRIPPDASVAAENNLTPHLSHRRFIYNLEYEGPQKADYLALDDARGTMHRRLTFGAEAGREGIRVLAAQAALNLLRLHLTRG